MQLKNTPVMTLDIPEFTELGISLSIKRDDLQHNIVSGNKVFKLYYHLEHCKKNNINTILTYGGAYSNHVHATAFAAKQLGMKSVAIIRGEQILPLNPTLKDCVHWGMTIEPVSRLDYQQKTNSKDIQRVLSRYPDAHVVPEGGADISGVLGAGLIMNEINPLDYDYVVCGCGTGTTLSGLIASGYPGVHYLGMAVLKGANWMNKEVQHWLDQISEHPDTPKNASQLAAIEWSINTDYHFGGYAKTKPQLTEFISQMKHSYDLPLEPIYTGKALYGVLDLAKKGFFKTGSRILFIHTGGLQGAR